MKGTWLTSALAVVFALGLTCGPAGSVPNFTGTWQIDKSRSSFKSDRPFAASIASRGVITLVIDHRDPELKIEQDASLAVAHRTVVSTYYTDGREASNRGARGEAITSTSHWDNGALVTDLKIVRGTQSLTRRDVMRLSEDGKSLTLEMTRNEPGKQPDTAHLVFVKQ
jgi:hypothetical protein